MTEVDKAYQHFKDVLKKHDIDTEWDLIRKAYHFAAHAHRDQVRQSGEPYIIHPIHVATNLAKLKMDSRAIAAGFLHDVLEDTETTPDDLDAEFGKEVRELVEGVSKLRAIRMRAENQYIENLRKMLIATAKDIRVLLIKLCDRLHNVQTLEYLPSSEQKRIALETLEIYAPIAQRLQLGILKGQLEDAAFKYIHPEQYRWLYNVTRKNYEKRQAKLTAIGKRIKDKLREEDITTVETNARIKFLYSLYQKLQRYDNDLSRIYDVIALRVVVPRIADCYAALGIIHREFKPLKGRIKDYIARPKANGYTSLHTTVQLDDGDIIEIQIRTPEMQIQAEYGIAAHWQYKEKGKFTRRQLQVSWVKELAKIMNEVSSLTDLEHIKLDLFSNRIFVLTPEGDVIDLPEGATPVDFAYHIHSDLGNKMTNAKVNGTITPLTHPLLNGDIVEVITDKNKKSPDIKWLDFVKTHLAQSKIKEAHRKHLSSWSKKLKK
ncbi:MAG: bifunctional (p)ppGpp synthetase/guanosine-3',5'-bis(diphosphate) 3'-pyrophosphohydrolase [Parcubacteria group bacterium]|nr:bifunctional (p)ppGpp synthetase/guanosine-3',5'-bis(diphosphate) 3'-pyrophosphohydrolase [Parcubacteria group bacterium]